MSQEQDDKLDKILSSLDELNGRVEKMGRGLYGDVQNKQVGLMQKHYDLADEVKALKEKDQRRTWMIAGFSSAASLGLPLFWEWIKKHFSG